MKASAKRMYKAEQDAEAARVRVGEDIYAWLEKKDLASGVRIAPVPTGTMGRVQFEVFAEGGDLNSILQGWSPWNRQIETLVRGFEKMLDQYGLYWDLKDTVTIWLVADD